MLLIKKPRNLAVIGLAAMLMLSMVGTGHAQIEVTKRVDISAFYGWRWGGNVNLSDVPTAGDRSNASLKAAGSYGGIVDLNIYETWEGHVLLEFYFSQQASKIEARTNNESKMEVADLDVRYYHGGIGYEWKLPSQISPYILFTMGATQFGSTTVENETAGPRKVDSETKFSWGFAGGIKYAITPRFGIRGDLRSFGTRSNIRDSGWACGYYSCGLVSYDQTIWQGDVTGGLYVSF